MNLPIYIKDNKPDYLIPYRMAARDYGLKQRDCQIVAYVSYEKDGVEKLSPQIDARKSPIKPNASPVQLRTLRKLVGDADFDIFVAKYNGDNVKKSSLIEGLRDLLNELEQDAEQNHMNSKARICDYLTDCI
ncbi:hypothetical protein ACXITX_12015 [Vibrio parahaemolyticus]